MRYLDFDGVILDTEDLLFQDWYQIPNYFELSEEDKIRYVQNANWEEIVHNAPIINDSIYLLNQMNPNESAILTLVHSLENEGHAKVKILRERKVKQTIILVPWTVRKVDIVVPRGNILVDDKVGNLDEWTSMGGYPMFFDLRNNNTDGWGIVNDRGYQRVRRIDAKKQ